MELPYCKLCSTRHPLGQHTAFKSSRDGVERHTGKESGPSKLTVSNAAPEISRTEKGLPVSSPARATKPKTTETKTNAKSNGVSMGKSRVNLPPPPPRKSGRPKKLKKLPKAKLGRPFASEKHLTLTALKPWEDVINKDGSKGISRAEFYRRKKKARQQKRAFQI